VSNFFLHPAGLCESENIGDRTRIWAFSHILQGAKIGEDCNICDGVFIENDVIVGDRVTIKSGVQLWDGLRVDDDVFIGPNATFTNDIFPRSRVWQENNALTHIHAGASIGANATILPGITIDKGAMIGAGAVVTKDVPANAIVYGNPGQIRGYVGVDKKNPSSLNSKNSIAMDSKTKLPGVPS
jgi:UDP-2-acetamido-3-amino-2,3-dideoxy-glucuronate N-acetyltransferase